MIEGDINPKLPCLRILSSFHLNRRRMSCSANSKSTYSSLSSLQSKAQNPIPVLIKLCMCSDEEYAYQTMKTLFSSQNNYSPNMCDDFGCNVLMYTLRYQRYRLFEFLLNETSLDLNLQLKDREDNTILHYAIVYGKDDTQIIDSLIERFKRFSIHVDQRNRFGFTPLLFAAYCGRYDLVLSLLSKTDSSLFVRDSIYFRNLLDYIEIDVRNLESIQTNQHSLQMSRSLCLDREPIRFHLQLNQTLHPRSDASHHSKQNHSYRNFFQHILPTVIKDRTESLRLILCKTLNSNYFSFNLIQLIKHINQRYPQIRTPRKTITCQMFTTSISTSERENSKTNVHRLFKLIDPELRPKAAQIEKAKDNSKITNINKRSTTTKSAAHPSPVRSQMHTKSGVSHTTIKIK